MVVMCLQILLKRSAYMAREADRWTPLHLAASASHSNRLDMCAAILASDSCKVDEVHGRKVYSSSVWKYIQFLLRYIFANLFPLILDTMGTISLSIYVCGLSYWHYVHDHLFLYLPVYYYYYYYYYFRLVGWLICGINIFFLEHCR